MRRKDAPGSGGAKGDIAKERDEILSRVPPAAHNLVPCSGRNALDSDLVVGGGVGPRRGLEAARLVPHDQRFSISRSLVGGLTGRISDAANDENVRTAARRLHFYGGERGGHVHEITLTNWDSLSPFRKVGGWREMTRGKIRRTLTTSNFLAKRARTQRLAK